MKPTTQSPTTQHTPPCSVVVDQNGTIRRFRGEEYIGCANSFELDLWQQIQSLLAQRDELVGACETALEALEPCAPGSGAARDRILKALASVQKGEG